VIGRRKSGLTWEPYQLSRDHKPELEEELQRITSMRGRVFPFFNSEGEPIGPHRVWHPHLAYPGLAMSRSLGDYVAHQYGVSADPEITEYNLLPEDEFLVIASDGVWEFLTNQNVIDILSVGVEDNDYKNAANDLIDQSHKQWLLNDT
jgi:serine/threonine protein phosphatase PrpC